MNPSTQFPLDQGAVEIQNPATITIDVSVFIESIRGLTESNKKMMDELTVLRTIFDNNRMLNDELKKYRQGALLQSKVDLLRAVTKIYADYKDKNEDIKFILAELKELIRGNNVETMQSEPNIPFDRKTMSISGDSVVITHDPQQEGLVAESRGVGYVFFGEPLIQEPVAMYKYEPLTTSTENSSATPVTFESPTPPVPLDNATNQSQENQPGADE